MRTTALRALAAVAVLFSLPQPSSSQSAEGVHTGDGKAVKAVVELFTSQGCSSCPAADALIGKIASQRKDVIALTLATDTWDYLGWKDTLSSPKFGARQKAYAKAFRDMIYTPQAVINGAAHVNGANRAQLENAIDHAAQTNVPMQLREEGGRLKVEVASVPNSSAKEATLWLAMLTKRVTVPVERGENSGKTLTYYNVVRDIAPIGMWSGKAVSVQFDRATLTGADTDAAAVLLQEGQGGPIIGAAMLDRF